MAVCLGSYSRCFDFAWTSNGECPRQRLGIFHCFRAFFLTIFLFPFLEIDRGVVLWVAAFLLGGFLSCLNSIAFGISLLFYLKTAAWAAAFLMGAGLGKKRSVREIFPLLFLMSGLALCIMGYGFLAVPNKTFSSMASTFYQSDVFAGYLLLLIPVASSLAVFAAPKDLPRVAMYGTTALLFVISLFLTDSRGAILVFGMISVLWGVVVYLRKPRAVKFVASGFVSALLLGVFYLMRARNKSLINVFLVKAGNPASWFVASHARLSFWTGGLKIFLKHPWLGSGLDTFGRLFPMVQEKFFWYSKYPHNFYIQTLSDGGLLTFLTVTGLLALALRSGFKALRQTGKDFSLGLGLTFGFLGGILHLFLDVDSNFLLWSVPFWFMGGLLVSLDSSAGLPLTGMPTDLSERRRGIFLKIAGQCLSLVFLGLQAAAIASSNLDSQAAGLSAQGRAFEAMKKENLAIHLFPWESAFFEHKAQQELFLCASLAEKRWCDEGLGDLDHALRIDPVHPLYLGELASLLSTSRGQNKRAEALLEKAVSLDPLNYPDHYVHLADLKLEDGDFSGAQRVYQVVIQKYPEADISRLPPFRIESFRNSVALARAGLAKIALKRGP